MEALYPVLVELVVFYRYRGIPGFVDVDATSKRLTELGITPHGLAMLHRRIRQRSGSMVLTLPDAAPACFAVKKTFLPN